MPVDGSTVDGRGRMSSVDSRRSWTTNILRPRCSHRPFIARYHNVVIATIFRRISKHGDRGVSYSWSGHAVRLDATHNSLITLIDVALWRSVILVVLAAVWTENVIAVCQKTASEQQRTTFVADEAIGVPLTPLEPYELGTVHSCTHINNLTPLSSI